MDCKIYDSKNLLDHNNIWVRGDRHREAEPNEHARGVELHGCVDETLHLRKLNDVVEESVDLAAGHAEHRAVHVDVLATRQFLMEAHTDGDEWSHAASYGDQTFRGRGHPREHL